MTTNFTASYRELSVYQMAFQGSIAVYHWAQPLMAPSNADFIRPLAATSRGVCAHIAAAWSQRRHPQGFIGNLSQAHLAATEMHSWIEAAIVAGCLNPDAGQDLHDHYRDLCIALDHLMAMACTALKRQQPASVRALPAIA